MHPIRLAMLLFLCVLTAVAIGCKEGGRFFGQMEGYIESEGSVGPEMAADVRRYAQSESKKPRNLRDGWQAAYRFHENQRKELKKDVGNYLQRERETLPTLDLENKDLGYGVKAVRERTAFPGEDE